MKRKEYRWKKKPQFEAPSDEFVEPVEEDSEERLDWTPCQYFKDFVTVDMLQEIAEETNLYSVQKNGKSVNTNAQEIEQLLGMYMHMGLVQMPNVRAYWEMETRYPQVCDVMSRGQFLNLLTVIHFQNNLNVSEDAKQDKVLFILFGWRNYANAFFAYLKNVTLLTKSWCLSKENHIYGATCQENLTSGGSRCGDVVGKVAISDVSVANDPALIVHSLK